MFSHCSTWELWPLSHEEEPRRCEILRCYRNALKGITEKRIVCEFMQETENGGSCWKNSINRMKLCPGRVRLGVRKMFFTERVVGH